MDKIFVFTIEGCIHCQNLKSKLNDEQILFNELDIYENEEIWEEIVNKTNEDIVPTVFIMKDNDGQGILLIPGVDFFSEDEVVTLINDLIK